MSDKLVSDHFEDLSEFEDLLGAAESNAESDWDIDFVNGMQERYEKYAERMFLNVDQLTQLQRIANGDSTDTY